MPRPCRRRRICAMPACGRFGPAEQQAEPAQTVTMTVDEFACIRLIDLEGLTQEECAARMDVARTTVQAIYASARTKLARFLVQAQMLQISGGEYFLCGGTAAGCGGCALPRGDTKKQMEMTEMKVAVTHENGTVFPHFGHTAQFKLYTIENGAVIQSVIVDTNGSGHGALVGLLQQHGVNCLLCGGIGAGALQAFSDAGIAVYAGLSGDADQAVKQLLSGQLSQNTAATCNHSGEHSGSCGTHSCAHG